MASARIMRGRLVAALLRAGWRPPPLTDEAADRLVGDIARVRTEASLGLSPTEERVVALMADGFTYREICKVLGCSHDTLRTRQKNAFRRLGARNAPHAVAIAFRRGMLW